MNENYLMHYDATTGDILGFYLKSIHGDNIPAPTIEITEEKHAFYMDNNGKYKLNIETLEDKLVQFTETISVNDSDRIIALENAISILMGV